MGLGMQLIHWDRELCEQLVERGFYVIRFDNRDAGRSTQIDAPVPPIMRAMAGFAIESPYLLDDMADDAFGLLDHLGIERVHVLGASMGGMVAQAMAIRAPRARALARLAHVDDGRASGRDAASCACGACCMRRAPQRPRRVRRALRPRIPDDRLPGLRPATRRAPVSWPARPSTAAIIRRARRASWRRSWRRATAPRACASCGCRPR